jgi:hypothetical protein
MISWQLLIGNIFQSVQKHTEGRALSELSPIQRRAQLVTLLEKELLEPAQVKLTLQLSRWLFLLRWIAKDIMKPAQVEFTSTY